MRLYCWCNGKTHLHIVAFPNIRMWNTCVPRLWRMRCLARPFVIHFLDWLVTWSDKAGRQTTLCQAIIYVHVHRDGEVNTFLVFWATTHACCGKHFLAFFVVDHNVLQLTIDSICSVLMLCLITNFVYMRSCLQTSFSAWIILNS